VKCDIPLLLSHGTLKPAKAKIDIDCATIQFLGSMISLIISSSGHLCLPISRPLEIDNSETQNLLKLSSVPALMMLCTIRPNKTN